MVSSHVRGRWTALLAGFLAVGAGTSWSQVARLRDRSAAEPPPEHIFPVSARGEYIVSLARHLSDYRSCWDSYRDTAYQLERMLTAREQLEMDALLSPADVAKVTEKDQDEVAFLDAQLARRRY